MPKRRDVSSLAATLTRLKPFPGAVLAVRKLAADPNTSVREIACAVELDLGVATDLLRIANAPASALAQRCTSVRHAAALLGLRRVCVLVESAAALALVEDTAASSPELCARVLAVAGVARMLAPLTPLAPDEVFTAALLHDVGVLLLIQSEDPFYEGLFDSDVVGEEPHVDDEVALMGFDHAELGAAVIRSWNLPEPLPVIVELHHDWERALVAGGTVCATIALLRVADKLVPLLKTLQEPTLDDFTPLLAEEPAFAHLGITREDLFRSWEGLRRAGDRASLFGEPPSIDVVQAAVPVMRPPPLRVEAPSHAVEPARAPPWAMIGAVVAALTAGVAALALLS